MIVKITRPEWAGQTLVFDTDDIEALSTPHDVQRASGDDWEFTGTSHLHLTFRQGTRVRWEDT